MGMHVGLVASRTTVVELRQAFAETFSHLEEVDSSAFAKADDLWRWLDAHQQFVSAAEWRPDNRGREVIAFWQDGPWAVFADPSYVLPSDDERLARLSTRFPTVLSFIVESAGGTAQFACFEQGKCRRKIMNVDGEVSVEGDPLPAETGIDTAAYYMEESERLARALGMSLEHGDGVALLKDCYAVCVVDNTDYPPVEPNVPPPSSVSVEAPKPRKPWWKLW